jgi:hypothetical protein
MKGAPDDWEQLLGQVFVDEMVQTSWLYYQCPKCEERL